MTELRRWNIFRAEVNAVFIDSENAISNRLTIFICDNSLGIVFCIKSRVVWVANARAWHELQLEFLANASNHESAIAVNWTFLRSKLHEFLERMPTSNISVLAP